MCSVGRSLMWELIRRGEIESVQVGAARRVPIAAVEDYIGRLRTRSRESAAPYGSRETVGDRDAGGGAAGDG